MPIWVDSATVIADRRAYGLSRDARYSIARAGRSASHTVCSCLRNKQRPGPLGSTCSRVNPSGRSSIRWFGIRNRRCQPEFAEDPKSRWYERALQPCSSPSRDPPLAVNSSHCSITSFQSAAIAVSTGHPKGRDPGGGENSAQASVTGACPGRRSAERTRIRSPIRRRSRAARSAAPRAPRRSEEHTSELQSQFHLVCRLLLEKKKKKINLHDISKKKKRKIQTN